MSVQVLDGPQVVAVHKRASGKHAEVFTLVHYLDVLKYKPGALPGATALARSPPSFRSARWPATTGPLRL